MKNLVMAVSGAIAILCVFRITVTELKIMASPDKKAEHEGDIKNAVIVLIITASLGSGTAFVDWILSYFR